MMLTFLSAPGYDPSAGAKSLADLGGSQEYRRTSAPLIAGAFFVPAMRYGGCAWNAFGHAGFLYLRSANPRTVAPNRCLAASGDDSKDTGVTPMASRLFLTRNPSARASAHRAMARAALFSNSSARVRLRRYNRHMDKARAFEAAARGEGAMS